MAYTKLSTQPIILEKERYRSFIPNLEVILLRHSHSSHRKLRTTSRKFSLNQKLDLL